MGNVKPLPLLFIFAAFAAMIWYAPRYLVHANAPFKADAIVLCVGEDFDARKKEVAKLMEEGYAKYLLIPAYGLTLNSPKTLSLICAPAYPCISPLSRYPYYFEGTHVEMLEAREMIRKAGFKAIIFVSSPYHMRRIKVIASTIFKDMGLNMRFKFSRYEYVLDGAWIFNKSAIKTLIGEYLKIVWFSFYRFFTGSSDLRKSVLHDTNHLRTSILHDISHSCLQSFWRNE